MRVNETLLITNYNNKYIKNISVDTNDNISASSENLSYNASLKNIPFQAISGVKPKKILNIDLEKNKLIKQIEKVLKTQSVDTELSDSPFMKLINSLNQFQDKLAHQAKIMQQIEDIADDYMLSSTTKISKIRMLQKELQKLKSNKVFQKKEEEKRNTEEKFDYELINKFKSSIMEDEFDLKKVYLSHYADLETISTCQELKEKYPKIIIPKNPREVIAQKLVDSLTREFFEELHWNYNKGVEKALFFADRKVQETLDELSKQSGLSLDFLYVNMAEEMHAAIVEKLRIALKKGFYTTSEQNKKSKPVSELDLKLLAINFDEFVLSTIKAQYLQGKKLNEIDFEDKFLEIKIPLNELKGSEYKFEKIDEKTKTLIKMAQGIQKLQRSYEYFTLEQLKSRLDYYSGTRIADNEEILENIINFDSCLEADKEYLIRFLKELDEVKDEKKSVKECLTTLKKEDIRPKEADIINEKELEQVLEKKREERQKTFILNELKENFDIAVNDLYSKNLSNIANICSKYRPQNLEQTSIDDAQFVINTIENALKEQDINISKLEATIARWDVYNDYKSKNANSNVFKTATLIADDGLGNIDVNKAGQYIMNSEIVDMYPDSLELVKYPDLLTKIVEKSNGDKQSIIQCLSKIDSYQELSQIEKSSLVKIMELFDSKDALDKTILKYIVDNEYVNLDTTTVIQNGTETHKASIKPSAKFAVIKKYDYPTCIDYLLDFEEALSTFGSAKGSSGIKQTGRNNNALEYKMELKLKRKLDRLYSSNNDYNFDVYSEKGLH